MLVGSGVLPASFEYKEAYTTFDMLYETVFEKVGIIYFM